MWSSRNLCQTLVFTSSTLLASLVAFNSISASNLNVWLVLFTILLLIASVWVTCREIQALLAQNGPNGQTTEKLARKYHILRTILLILPKTAYLPNERIEDQNNDVEPADVELISNFLAGRYVRSWYSQYISKEDAFLSSCKDLLNQMVSKVFQISSNIETVHLSSEALCILLRHFKEYKKALKRMEKTNKGSVEDCYKFIHPTSTIKGKSSDAHCQAIVKSFLKELLPWELWDTPHATLLASILAKRLNIFIDNTLSDPKRLRSWIKQMILATPAPESNNVAIQAKIEVVTAPEIKEEKNETMTLVESALTNMISNSTAPILQRAEIDESVIDVNVQELTPTFIRRTKPIEINPSASEKFKNEVKIYDRIVEGSVKTWDSDIDLECVSLGHDLLASLDGELELGSRISRLWEADGGEVNEISSPNPPSTGSSTKTAHRLWFGEEDNLDMELNEESPPKNAMQSSTVYANFNLTKPLGIQNIKELQNISKNTVNQAKNKIGDLQDEAAGVMEGILDFGIAGFRKGLRLTGLQDGQAQSASKLNENQTGLVATIGQVLSTSRRGSQTEDTGLISKKDNIDIRPNGSSFLVKQQKVSSQDSFFLNKDSESMSKSQPIDINQESPDYEYEEAEDLSSTIAKLRDLLQQRAGEISHSPEDMLSIDGGKNKKSLSANSSPMHRPIASIPSTESEHDFTILGQNSAELMEAEEVLNNKALNTGNMQRLDKLFTRTVTGVFNTIKTAVGGDSSDIVAGHTELGVSYDRQMILKPQSNKNNWLFIEGDVDMSVLIGRLLVERRGYCIVEAAQDSLEMLGGARNYLGQNIQEETAPPIIPDELDEAEILNQCPLWQMCMELIVALLDGIIQKDAVVKCITVAFGEKLEEILQHHLSSLCSWLRSNVISNFQKLSKERDNEANKIEEDELVGIDELHSIIMERIPWFASNILGADEVSKSVRTLLESLDQAPLNREVMFNLLDMFALYFLKSSASRQNTITPPPSA